VKLSLVWQTTPSLVLVGRGQLRMAADWVRGGYPRVSGPAGSGLGMIFHPRFSGSVSGSVFHP
jgi:hypothetical protein